MPNELWTSQIENRKSQIKNQKSPGWFVPDARWLELREALAEKIEALEKPK